MIDENEEEYNSSKCSKYSKERLNSIHVDHLNKNKRLYIEELILNLDICVDSLKSNVISFKSNLNPTISHKLEFMFEYTILEENILNIFDKLNSIKISKNQQKRIEILLGEFNIYWKDFQDEWEEEFWRIYGKIRNKDKKLIFPNLEYMEELEKTNKEQEEAKNPGDEVVDGQSEIEIESRRKSISEEKTLNKELKEIMKRFRRNSTPGARLPNIVQTLQTEDNLNWIDQDLRMATYDDKENGRMIGGGEKRKDRACFPVCCIIY